jgi:hypothetical protein
MGVGLKINDNGPAPIIKTFIFLLCCLIESLVKSTEDVEIIIKTRVRLFCGANFDPPADVTCMHVICAMPDDISKTFDWSQQRNTLSRHMIFI